MVYLFNQRGELIMIPKRKVFYLNHLFRFFDVFEIDKEIDCFYRLAFLIAFYLGIRREKIVEFNLKDLDWENRFYTPRECKYDSDGGLYLPYELFYHLKEYYERNKYDIKEAKGYFFYTKRARIFHNKNGSLRINYHISSNHLWTKFREYMKKAGLNTRYNERMFDYCIHSFRGGLITYLLNKGIDPLIVKRISRHKSFQSMRPYIQLSTNLVKNAMGYAFEGKIEKEEPSVVILCKDTPLARLNQLTLKNFQNV